MTHHRLMFQKLFRPYLSKRNFTDPCVGDVKTGLVLGAYDGCNKGEYQLTHAAAKFNEEVGGKITELLKGSGVKLGKARVFNNLGSYYAVSVTGVGQEGLGFNELENINECKENIRIATAVGARALQDMGVQNIMVDSFTCPEAAGEGSSLAVWKFEEYRSKLTQSTSSKVELFDDPDRESWEKGVFQAEAQNIARLLSDIPANIMTPSMFAQKAIEILCPCGVQVEVRDRDWIEQKKMSGFLGVAVGGSCEPPLLLEISYCGGNAEDKPVIFVGKGMTFESGGICLLPCKGMAENRADMAGAAVLVGTFKALAQLNVPMNTNALIPLCENMPGGAAIKPGDVLVGMSGKSIRLEDTSKEARVIMSDVLAYSATYKPCLVASIGTQTHGVRCCLGSSSTGVFSTSEIVWRELSKAGAESGDRLWRLPLWKYFSDRLTYIMGADINNIHKGRGGEACAAASFLMEFVPPVDFIHFDITGTGMLSSGFKMPYLREGTMTGRPTRALIQFLYQMACPNDKTSPC